MRISKLRWNEKEGWQPQQATHQDADLVLVFADNPYFHHEDCYASLRAHYPAAIIAGCSTAGSASDTSITDGDLVGIAVKLERGRVRLAFVDIDGEAEASVCGQRLMTELKAEDLRHVFLLSDGLQVNGSELAHSMNQFGIAVTGGLAGDGTRFGKTYVMANEVAKSGRIAAIGFYGEMAISSGCFAGWREFGAERIVTRSERNVVYEIDGEPALALYKRYLGEQAAELPYSGLRFPLSIQADRDDSPLIRTLLAIDETANSLTFAGDVPQGYRCKLMQTNLDSLIENAGLAAQQASRPDESKTGFCLVVSCVGRRLVLGQLVEEELEIVQDILGEQTAITGFYSYGELAPFAGIMQCQLHNQTMTLTTFYE